ncbi:MAG: hypothetical protein ACI9SJ_002420 [Flavobacteriaceae bacterium]|jgi:hypothetical protein|uniref:DUF4252 domain-containing protein n=1 Tax=Candidatus Marifrigoribacter sp. Uisw_064 TaxID=3230970 RepID=UPI003AD85959
MILTRYIIGLGLAALTLFSCSNEKSLQKYLVEKQEDDTFLKIDIATSLLQAKGNSLSQEEKDILETVKKINVVAFPIKEGNDANYDANKKEINDIMKQDKYKTLMKYGSNNKGATLKYLGEEDAIDEIIVLASDAEKGFAVIRLLGDNMRPDQMLKLMNSIDNGDIDVTKLSTIGELFKM